MPNTFKEARDPARIRPLLSELERLWLEFPEQRFGQLLMNLARTPEGFADVWEWDTAEYRSRIAGYRSKYINEGG